MVEKWIKNKYIILLLIIGAVYFFLKYLCPLLAPVLIAVLFLTMFYPTLDDIQKKTHIKKQFLAVIFIVFAGAVIALLAWIIITVFMQYVPAFLGNTGAVKIQITLFIRECSDLAERVLGINATAVETVVIEKINILIEDFEGQILPGILNKSWGYARSIFSLGGFIGITVVATVLLAKDYDEILDKMAESEKSRMVLQLLVRVIKYIATFIKAQAVIMITIGGLSMLVLGIFKVEQGVFWGLLAGFLDVLPFIGTGIVLLPLAVWQLIQGKYLQAVICVILYVLCILIRESMEPKLIGAKVGIYPVGILISVYAGLKLFGISGIFLGPLGLVIIQQVYNALIRPVDDKDKSGYDEKEENEENGELS